MKKAGVLPRYFVEDDHGPIVPKSVYYQVQGERKRRSALMLDPSKLRFGKRLALNGRLICGHCGRVLKRYVKPDETKTDWRCRQRAMVKKSNLKEGTGMRCDLRIVREADVQNVVAMAFNELPSMRDELIVAQERLLTGEIGRIDALLSTLNGQQDQMENRLDQLAATMEEPVNTTVVSEVGGEPEVDGSSTEVEFLKAQIVSIRNQKNALYAERAEHANKEVQLRILLELVEQILGEVKEIEGGSGACYDYEEFFRRTRYTVPEGVIQDGMMVRFDNDLVIRYLENILVEDHGYTVRFKAGVEVKVEG